MRDLLEGVKNAVDSLEGEELVDIDSPEVAEEQEEPEDWTKEDEDRFNGEEAGVVFADRHVLEKITLFAKVYREKGFSEAFIEGFMEGINGALGSSIYFGETVAESGNGEVDSGQ